MLFINKKGFYVLTVVGGHESIKKFIHENGCFSSDVCFSAGNDLPIIMNGIFFD
jgi:hypothetical protein